MQDPRAPAEGPSRCMARSGLMRNRIPRASDDGASRHINSGFDEWLPYLLILPNFALSADPDIVSHLHSTPSLLHILYVEDHLPPCPLRHNPIIRIEQLLHLPHAVHWDPDLLLSQQLYQLLSTILPWRRAEHDIPPRRAPEPCRPPRIREPIPKSRHRALKLAHVGVQASGLEIGWRSEIERLHTDAVQDVIEGLVFVCRRKMGGKVLVRAVIDKLHPISTPSATKSEHIHTSSAPRPLTISLFPPLATPTTVAPLILHSCTSKLPTPPLAPYINTLSSALTSAVRSIFSPVCPLRLTAHASSALTSSGSRMTAFSAGSLTNSASTPFPRSMALSV